MNFTEVLGEELANQVNAAIDAFNASQTDASKKVRFVDLSEGGYVSIEKHNRIADQVTDLRNTISQRDTDMADLNAKLEAAVADGTKLAEAQQTLATLQTQYSQDQASWEQKLKDQAYEFRIRELTGGLQFSSNAAKSEFIREAIGKKFAMEGDKILGFDDYLKSYKEADPGAFAADPGKQPEIIHPGGGGTNPPGGKMSLAEAMKRANAGEKVDVSSLRD